MAIKVYADGNYLVIDGDGLYIDLPTADVEVKYTADRQDYNIYDKGNDKTVVATVKVPGVQKSDGTDDAYLK